MTTRAWAVLWMTGLVLAATAAVAAEPAAAPPAPPKLGAVVKVVTGTVETRAAVGQPWTPVKEGMRLDAGADVRTGFRARCILDMTDSLVQVDPLSVVRISELSQEGNKVRTRLVMKQGNTQAVVEKGKIESDFAIVTPSATLSVRGTRGIHARYYRGQGGQFGLAGSGLISVADAYFGRQHNVHPGENTDDGGRPPILFLVRQFLPQILDNRGYEPRERFASGRWHTSTPFPAGLTGSTGGPLNTGSQEILLPPTGNGGSTGEGELSGEPPVDITHPPAGLGGQPPQDITYPPGAP